MSKRAKPVSLEEKRKRMCDFFYERRDFFNLKELEKFLPKEKGIVVQSVKDVLQSLIDDRLVIGEKIGSGNYFWSFPSTALQSRKNKIEVMNTETEKLNRLQVELQKQIVEATKGRPDGPERDRLLARAGELEAAYSVNAAELEKFKDLDPDLFDKKKKQMLELKATTDRWTDNIFTLQSYCANNFNISRSDFASQFGVAEDFDYIA